MRCSHTRKPFKIRTDLGPNPAILVEKDQVEQVKAALINCRAIFAIDHNSISMDDKRLYAVCFRPDVDAEGLEATLASGFQKKACPRRNLGGPGSIKQR